MRDVVHGSKYTGSIYDETSLTALIKAVTLAGSFLPGLASTPLLTSTPYGCTFRIALLNVIRSEPPCKQKGKRLSGFRGKGPVRSFAGSSIGCR